MKNSTSTSSLHLGFTLVELMIVIGIIGILAATILGVSNASGDSAQAAKCLANMKNLATAAQSYGMEHGEYPIAGSVVRRSSSGSSAKGNRRTEYTERPGWVSGDTMGQFPSTSPASIAAVGFRESDEVRSHYAITNGALWRYVSGNVNTYVCPIHKKKSPGVKWSYLMNAYFGWSADPSHAYGSFSFQKYGKLGDADRRVLFAEIPFQGPGSWKPDGTGSGDENDGVLQYENCSHTARVAGESIADGNECVGANHKVGKHWFAHVVFADGHVEKIRCSSSNGKMLEDDKLKKLTTLLCEGKAIGFNGSEYEELK